MMESSGIRQIEIPVMHCFDDNYVIPAAVSFYSMLTHADKSYFYRLFVLHSDITVQNQKKLRQLVERFDNAVIKFIDMRHQLNDIWDAMPNVDHLAKEVLYKLLAPSLFPQYEKIIITDVDVVFLGDIAPSYKAISAESDVYFAGVRQINPEKTFLRPYYESYQKAFSDIEVQQLKICGGYLVANLKKLREDKMVDVFISYLKNNVLRLLQAEQDVINFCCRDKQVLYLPLNYVVCSYMYDICQEMDICSSDPYYTYAEMKHAMEKPVQLHYATKTKPWNAPDSTKAEIWFEYLNKTEFKSDYQAKWCPEKVSPLRKSTTNSRSAPPLVKASVLICSYNHENFIEKALESVLNQKTEYSFEVIVADDASTDQTQNIIRTYQKKYPEKMKKCILRSQNVGIGNNYYDALTQVDGEYLAICDGDDCWIDENKLQKQIDFLEANREYTVVCSDFMIHHVGSGAETDKPFDIMQYLKASIGVKNKYTMEDLLYSRFIASCTLMLRWQLAGCVPEFLKAYRVIDFPLELIHATYGYIKVFKEKMAMYNVHPKSISNQSNSDVVNDCIMLVREVNQFLDYSIDGQAKEYLQKIKAAEKNMRASAGQTTVNDDTVHTDGNAPDNSPAKDKTAYQKLRHIYNQWAPMFLQRTLRLLKRGLFICYKECLPLYLRNHISRIKRRLMR